MTAPIISRYMDTNGDGTGATNAVGNYTTTAAAFYYQPVAGAVAYISRMIVSVEDTGGMQAEEYGNIGAALTNGIEVKVVDDVGTIYDLTSGVPIKTNSQWGQVCYDVEVKAWGSGNDLLVARWTFAQSGTRIELEGDNNERIEAQLNDNFTDLISHRFIVQGYEVAV
jgi:hypothetical protein